jgi:hypothetical protein
MQTEIDNKCKGARDRMRRLDTCYRTGRTVRDSGGFCGDALCVAEHMEIVVRAAYPAGGYRHSFQYACVYGARHQVQVH